MAAHAHRLGFAVKLLGDGGLPRTTRLAARGMPWRDGRVMVARASG